MNSIKNKALPIGVDDFKNIVEDYYFVDKSKFIEQILNQKYKVSLITRPRRFGKTLLLSMLRYFFTLDNAQSNRKLFCGLQIENHSLYMKRQGISPVIFISLKGVTQDNFDLFLTKMTNLMSDIYSDFSYIKESSELNEIEKINFERIYYRNSNQIDLEESLKNLTKFLYKHYHQKVIILIDEYDSPILAAWKNNYYDKSINFMRNFFGETLKTNEYLDFAVLTGITRVSKESLFSGLNNFEIFSVLSDNLDDIFGFTENEVIKILQDYNVTNAIKEIKDWYDGYIFGKSEIYNPWSIMKYIINGYKAQSYWINTSGNILINNFFKNIDTDTTNEIMKLINGESITKYIDENLVYSDIEDNISALYSILLVSGYLKVIDKHYESGKYLCSLKIPNKEVLYEYENKIYQNLSQNAEIQLKTMMNAMVFGYVEVFSDTLQKFLLNVVSNFDVTKKTQEEFYHGLILGLTASISNDYIIESNLESGYGRFDISCIPKDKNKYGIILELKSSKSKRSLNSDASNALKQIQKNKYDTVFNKFGIDRIWKYGIAFFKKDVVIKNN